MTKKEKLIKRLRGLKQNKNLSDNEIERLANRNLEEKELKILFSCLSDKDCKNAADLYYSYLDENSFETIAEKSTLINMIIKEFQLREVNLFIKKERDEKKGAVRGDMIDRAMELGKKIYEEKQKLGMLSEKENDSFTNAWKELKQKAINYYNEYGGEIYYKCPHCLQFSRQIMQIDGYDIKKAHFFKGTTLYNKGVMDAFHNKEITKERAAQILGVHHKYITLIYNEIYLKEKK